jgi:hypothetical protein
VRGAGVRRPVGVECRMRRPGGSAGMRHNLGGVGGGKRQDSQDKAESHLRRHAPDPTSHAFEKSAGLALGPEFSGGRAAVACKAPSALINQSRRRSRAAAAAPPPAICYRPYRS